MPSSEDQLFVKIALAQRFCSQQQIDECLMMQAQDPDPATLAEILLFKGFISKGQHAMVLKLQNERRKAVDRDADKSVQDAPLQPNSDTHVPPPSAKTVQAICVMCDTPFEGTPDPTGRVGCPSCHTTFTPK